MKFNTVDLQIEDFDVNTSRRTSTYTERQEQHPHKLNVKNNIHIN